MKARPILFIFSQILCYFYSTIFTLNVLCISSDELNISDESLRLFQEGNELYTKGDVTGAISRYTSAVSLDSKFADAHCNLGSALIDIGDIGGAVDAYSTALEINPSHPDANYNFAMILHDGGAHENAIYHYKKAVGSNPDHFEAWSNLGGLQLEVGDHAGAVESIQNALELIGFGEQVPSNLYPLVALLYFQLGSALSYLDPARCVDGSCTEHAAEAFRKCLRYNPSHIQAEHSLKAILADESVETASSEYVKSLFDDYAETFDSSLSNLEYKAPELIHQTMVKLLQQSGTKQSLGTVVDAGCGTGLIGPLFKDISKSLIGIDLSANMLEKAKEKGVYETLLEGDIATELSQLSSKGVKADAIIAADVLVYLGNLQDFFEAATSLLETSGFLAFTVERLAVSNKNWQILPSGRFSHSKQYIDGLAEIFGLKAADYLEIIPRLEGGKPIPGHLFVFQKA